jgi:hypothetical protein
LICVQLPFSLQGFEVALEFLVTQDQLLIDSHQFLVLGLELLPALPFPLFTLLELRLEMGEFLLSAQHLRFERGDVLDLMIVGGLLLSGIDTGE